MDRVRFKRNIRSLLEVVQDPDKSIYWEKRSHHIIFSFGTEQEQRETIRGRVTVDHQHLLTAAHQGIPKAGTHQRLAGATLATAKGDDLGFLLLFDDSLLIAWLHPGPFDQ